MTMKSQMVKWGNSLAIRIPKTAIEEACLKEGDYLEIEVAEGQLALRKLPKTRRVTLAELVDQITPDNRYAEVSSGSEVGKEKVEW